MNVFFSIISTLLAALIMCQCSGFNKSSQKKQPTIIEATFDTWRKPPLSGSEVPEKGVDLTVILENWPSDAEPLHIIYDGWKSFPAEIADSTGREVTIKARIIISSSMLNKTSGKTTKTDRLVYRASDTTTTYLPIKSWE